MKKTLLFLALVLSTVSLMAQCDDLFISEYVEGYANNKALEIYNPTGSAINLSDYSIARFSNGNTTAAPPTEQPAYIVQLPDVMLASNDVFVVVIDKTDMTQWDSQFDKPTWNGKNVIDVLLDAVTGEPLLDDDGNMIYGPQYQDGSALFGDDYDEKYDLQCKADIFLCPVYDINRSMYFNGNDAVALIKGTSVSSIDDLVDVIGVIGEDPEDTIGEDAWVNADGFWITKDRSLVRKPDVASGRNNPNDVIFGSGGTFDGAEWDSFYKNHFTHLGIHNSVCNSTPLPDRFSCSLGPITSTSEINQIPFKMYPNPNSSSQLTLESADTFEKITIYNLLGQNVYSASLGTTNKTNVDISTLGKGMYLVNLHFNNNNVSIEKLLVE